MNERLVILENTSYYSSAETLYSFNGMKRLSAQMPMNLFLLLLPLSLICFGAQVSVGSLNTTNQVPRHTATGVVANGLTGEPIRRALVQLNGSTVLTGSDGHFVIADVPEGQAIFSTQKPGFFDPRSMSGGQWGRPNPTFTVGSDNNDFHLTLLPNSKIVGRITDSNGEPVENAQVQVLFEQISQGRRQWQPRLSANTDEDGSYRLDDLTPGRYTVFAGGHSEPPQSWNAPLEVSPPKYYPDAPDLASAQPIDLRAGQEFRADFRFRTERAYRVTAQASGVPAGMSVNFSLQNASGQNIWFEGMNFDPTHGRFIAPALPSGTWTIWLNASDGQGHTYQARQEIAVNHADIADLQILLHRAASIPVVLNHPTNQPAETQPQIIASGSVNPGISATLVSVDPYKMEIYGMQMQGDPPVTEFHDVAPGKYKLDVQAFGSECVETSWYGSTDVTRDYLTVGTDGATQPLTINLRADCSTLSAKLRPEEQSHSGFLLVVPSSSLGEPKILPFQAQPSSNQVVGFINSSSSIILSPGSYQVFAFTNLDGLEYANPEALRSYPSQSLTLGPGQKTELSVTLTERKEN
jgi:hypothetical protein